MKRADDFFYILATGLTRDAEGFLLNYARQKGYNPVEISADLTLWIPK